MSRLFKNESVSLEIGSGGKASWEFFMNLRKIMNFTGRWTNTGDDAAVYDLGDKKLVMTTDAFIIDPLFFKGGDIGKIAICGTINDVSVMGAKPIGISLSCVIEEGFSTIDLERIIRSIDRISKEAGVPVVTGDTKVTEKGKIDKIEITTAGVGLATRIIENKGARPGDKIIASGNLGEHGAVILSHRFNYKTKLKSDCKPLNKEIQSVAKFLNACKDPTRGGLAANLNEMAEKSKVRIVLDEKTLPYKKEVRAVTELLGLDIFSLASEGRFLASVSPKNVDRALKILKTFNKEAMVIGRALRPQNSRETGVYLETELGGLRKIEAPRGKLIPRIC